MEVRDVNLYGEYASVCTVFIMIVISTWASAVQTGFSHIPLFRKMGGLPGDET